MEIEDIKRKMLQYKDFYGGDLSATDLIENAKTKKELASVIEKHRHFLEDMLSDANSHLDRFKEKLGLRMFEYEDETPNTP